MSDFAVSTGKRTLADVNLANADFHAGVKDGVQPFSKETEEVRKLEAQGKSHKHVQPKPLKAAKDISHEGGKQVTKRSGKVVVQHDEGDAEEGSQRLASGTISREQALKNQHEYQRKGGKPSEPTTIKRTKKPAKDDRDALPVNDKTLQSVNDANLQYYNNSPHAGMAQDAGKREISPAQKRAIARGVGSKSSHALANKLNRNNPGPAKAGYGRFAEEIES